MKPSYYVSLDVGGTHARVALLEAKDEELHILKQEKLYMPQDFETGFKLLVEKITRISQGHRVRGIGAAFPGQIDPDQETIFSCENLPQWQRKPISVLFEKALNIPTKLFHDTAAAALGEAVYGQGKDLAKFVFLIWGTGVGGAKIERLGKKFHVSSFEPGHYSADPNGQLCSCGLHGCPELLIGGKSLKTKLGRDLSEVKDSDPIWAEVVTVSTQTVINTLCFHPVPIIIFGGGLIIKRPFLLDRIQTKLAVQPPEFSRVQLQLTSLGDDTALYGSVAGQLNTFI